MVEYDNVNYCNKCGSPNEVKIVDSIDGRIPLECYTICSKCGFEDYWATGFFESRQDLVKGEI